MPATNSISVHSVVEWIENASIKQIRHLQDGLRTWRLEPAMGQLEQWPRWDARHLSLFMGSRLLYKWQRNAHNQIAILTALEKFKWTQSSVGYEHYGFRGDLSGQKMHDAIYRLNLAQSEIRFSYSGKRSSRTEEWVGWKILEKKTGQNHRRCLDD